MKTSFSLVTFFLIDLVVCTEKSDFAQFGDRNETIHTISLGNRGHMDREYFLSVTKTRVIVSEKGNNAFSAIHEMVLPQSSTGYNFQLDNSDSRFVYLHTNDSALLCTDNPASVPECLLIQLSKQRIDQIIPVPNDYRQGNFRMPIWNAFQIPSNDGTVFMTAYLNATASYEPSWITRQEYRDTGLITIGAVADHQLGRFSSNLTSSSENVYSFEYGGFAYFLRYAYRFNFVPGDTHEWSWQLTRVCMNDRTRWLRSRSSIPLVCGLQLNEREFEFGWKPTKGYLDRNGHLLYLYVQPNLSIHDPSVLKELRHRICSFDMKSVAIEFERVHKRCFRDYSELIAVHGGDFQTKKCSDYTPHDEEEQICNHDICNPDECMINPFYHTEFYDPIHGTLMSIIDFKYESDQSLIASNHKPLDMLVTKSDFQTNQVFVRNKDGTVFMAFLDAVSNNSIAQSHSPAWINRSIDGPISDQRLLQLPDHTGVQLVDVSKSIVSVFKTDCDLYTECHDLMDKGTGHQARKRWACGWCAGSENGYSTTEGQCWKMNGLFYMDSCPPRADCYEPRHWSPEKEVSLKINGLFPSNFEYSIDACGSECKITNMKEQQIECTASPRFHLDEKTHTKCGVEVSVLDGTNNSVLWILQPACALSSPAINGGENGKTDKVAWIAFIGVSVLVIMAVVIYAILMCRRRRRRKRQRSENSLTLPMTTVVELSRDNEYVQRNISHIHPPLVSLAIPRPYENLSHLVPREKLIRLESIEFECVVGSGHFGQVFKGRYTPTEDQPPITVAIKTLMADTNTSQFIREGMIMETFDHPNVLSLIGITFNGDKPFIITPYMGRGDLLTFIRNSANNPSLFQLLQFGVEIAKGMQYLHKLKVIHRDLAARNCMLDDRLHVRIADFGMSRDVYESEQYMSSCKEGVMPVRWMPLESIEQGEFTFKSDVWSYGIVIWELITHGTVPYSGMAGREIVNYLKAGRRLDKPNDCPESIYDIMRLCWSLRPNDRPDFPAISDSLPAAMMDTTAYYNVSPIIQPPPPQIVTSA